VGNYRSKNAKMRGFHIAFNTLLGLNELKYFWFISCLIICFVDEFHTDTLPAKTIQAFLAYQQHYCFSDIFIEILCREQF
jgi:hypothetical protein